jgi:hypothetical protein
VTRQTRNCANPHLVNNVMYQFLSWEQTFDYIVELKAMNLSHCVDMLTATQGFLSALLFEIYTFHYLQMWDRLFAWVACLHLTKNNPNVYPTLWIISWILTTTISWYSLWGHNVLFMLLQRWNCYLSLKLKVEMSVWICNCVLPCA